MTKGKAESGGWFKDWFTFVTSIIAFVISIITFYSSSILEVDDFRISLQGVLSNDNVALNNQYFNTLSDMTATFINTGTRPVALESLLLVVAQGSPLTGNYYDEIGRAHV